MIDEYNFHIFEQTTSQGSPAGDELVIAPPGSEDEAGKLSV